MQLTKSSCVTNDGTFKQNPASSEIDFCSKLMLLSLQVQVFHLNSDTFFWDEYLMKLYVK